MAEKSVTLIPARRQIGNNVHTEEKPKLRVAAYCRVSTDSDEQATSYEAQVGHLPNSFIITPNGNLLASSPMTVSAAPTPKNVANSIV